MLHRRGINAICVDAPIANTQSGREAETLLAEAETYISREQPDAIVVGLSSPGQGGIDEAFLKMANCPTFLLQDFWGESNPFFNAYPDVFLVLDSAAAELTQQKYAAECVIIGSSRHADYRTMEINAIRNRARAKLCIDAGPVIGWFGQSLHHLSGYEEVIENWVETVETLNAKPTVLYKPHPRENNLQRKRTIEVMSRVSDNVRFLEGWPVEDSLLACDCVCSIMSNCLYDGAYLNFYSETPLLSPVSVLTSESLMSNLNSKIAFDALPYTRLGLATTVLSKETLADNLEFALSNEGIERAWFSAKRNLVPPDTAATDALAFIREFVARKSNVIHPIFI
ncbi:MAG: hypothetical protein K0Q50_1735 [Vampirovibrio sp.]|nr:hypothetical protein [Vampirovibrio sp.]